MRIFSQNIKNRIHHGLTSRYLPLFLASAAFFLTLPSVQNGLQFDDYGHKDILLGKANWVIKDGSLTGIFSFLNGVMERTKLMMETGFLPWWTFEKLRIAFFRPLAEITHWLDYRLWPDYPALMHCHNLFWFGILIFLAAILYRKVMGSTRVAGLAALFYTIDDAHGGLVGWLANRNAMISVVFGLLTLIIHIRWCRENWNKGAALGPICLLLGLLSSEAALAAGAYLLAYESFLGHGNLRHRVIRLIPYGLVITFWWTFYHRLGFGTWGSGAYLDPGQEPLLFLCILIERIPILLLGQWMFPNSGFYGYLPKSMANLMWLGAIIFIGILFMLLIPLLKYNVKARFWALGMFLSLLPICATFPANRLLLFAGMGAMGLLAQFMAFWKKNVKRLSTSKIWQISAHIFVFIFFVIHGIAAPLILPVASKSFSIIEEIFAEKPLMNLLNKHDLSQKTLIFINPPVSFFILHTHYIIMEYGYSPPARIRTLTSGANGSLKIKRIHERSLELQPETGFITMDLDKLFRGSAHPMQIGQRIELTDMTAEVLSLTNTKDRRPLRVRFTFKVSLEDSSLLFLEWKNNNFIPFALPDIGESVRLPRILWPI